MLKVVIHSEIVVNRKPEDDLIASLHREATQWKERKNWNQAVQCLQSAKGYMERSTVIYPVLTWLRLPLFLQQADRYPEALIEFQWLIDTAEARTARGFSHLPKRKIQQMAREDVRTIKDKMRLAAEREAKRRAKANGPLTR